MLRTFVLFALLAAGVSAWDHFQFDITFLCHLKNRPHFNFRIEWFEHDSTTANDQITQPLTSRGKMGAHSFSMAGAQDGDGPGSYGYSPIAKISHDCTSDKKRVDMKLTITTRCGVGHNCHYRIIRDLTDDWGKYEMAANDFKFEMTPFPDFP